MAEVIPPASSPDGDLLAAYRSQCQPGDLFGDAAPDVVDHWQRLADGLTALAPGGFDALHERLIEEVQELGMAFRAAGEEDERDWPLSPFPLVIGTAEWEGIAAGIIERAELVEQVVSDLYGAQSLVTSGHIPAAVVTGSPHFVPRMVGVPPPGGRHYLHLYAADLARGPTGEWRVLADRARFAAGIGYALENRLATSRITGTLLSSINARRLAGFFSDLRRGIAADCQRIDPRIALLTPGRFNQSYAEQAHLARYLGFPLVEGRDLAVSEDKLYVRTIAGLKRIDAIWRWLDTRQLDPLSFDSRSQIGVPDMMRALESSTLVSANWPGAGVVESPAFSAFLPRLAGIIQGRPLKLPNVATWWCGQVREHGIVLDRLDGLVVCSAFGNPVAGLPDGRTRPGATFTGAERDALVESLARRPMDYCGQEIVRLSTTPALVGNALDPRPFTLRVFVARDASGAWTVMPGGFARLSAQSRLRSTLMGEGDLSADVCVVDQQPVAQTVRLAEVGALRVHRRTGILPSQAADNLFWFGRYLERTEATARVIRALLGSMVEVDGGARRDTAMRDRLIAMLANWGAIDPARLDTPGFVAQSLAQHCADALADDEVDGSVAALLATVRDVSRRLRDRLSNDVWRIANLPLPAFDASSVDMMLAVTNRIIDRLGAIAGLMAENMGRGAAWRFLDMGRRVERAGATIDYCARLVGGADPANEDLSLLLDIADSQILYRTRYLAGPARDPVLDLVALDGGNPRSIAFQATCIDDHLAALPRLGDDQLPEDQQRRAIAFAARLESSVAAELDSDYFKGLAADIDALSDAIAQRYFLAVERPARDMFESLLG